MRADLDDSSTGDNHVQSPAVKQRRIATDEHELELPAEAQWSPKATETVVASELPAYDGAVE